MNTLKKGYDKASNKLAFLTEVRSYLHQISDLKMHPVNDVRWVPINQVNANAYNPNAVAKREMKLLAKSIEKDGYTQPVVTIFDEATKKYVIVDGYHRTLVMKSIDSVKATTGGYLPVVVLEKDVNDRMASTIRHNRARGTHSIDGMGNIVFKMLENGWTDSEICNELGMEAEEIIRIKHVTGYSKLFADISYNKAWHTKRQLLIKKRYADVK